MTRPALSACGLRVTYAQRRSGWPWRRCATTCAVDDVSLDVMPGEIVGLIGESGCGKSTLARALVGLQPLASGRVTAAGTPQGDDARARRARCRAVQLVFQDAAGSLDPRLPVAASIAEPLLALCPALDAAARAERVAEVMHAVGLSPALGSRHPHALSGGQCQRAAIARALTVRPAVLVCDEAVSALDVSVRAQIVNLLARLRREQGLAVIFIAHDLGIVRQLCDRVAVMYAGRIVEQAATRALFADPQHPYARALLAAMPDAPQHWQAWRESSAGHLPWAGPHPPGCAYAPRCARAEARCARQRPALRATGQGGYAACIHASQAEVAA